MSITSISYVFAVSASRCRTSTTSSLNLSAQLSTGASRTNYAGMGINEGFAIAARSQLANIAAFADTMTNVASISISPIPRCRRCRRSATGADRCATAPQDIDHTGQTIAPGERGGRASPRWSASSTRSPATAICFPAPRSNAGGRTLRRHPQRHRHAGRLEDGDRRTRAGRLGTNGIGRLVIRSSRPRTVGVGGRRCRGFAVRAEDCARSPRH